LLARIRHPNVVTVHGADRHDGRTGLWMELLRGETLEDELTRRGVFSAKALLTVAGDLGGAINAVHAAGLLHRDIKAQNAVRTDDGRLVLMDFGAGGEGGDTSASSLAGTPAYLAPEVLAGAPPSVSSDVYALGVLLFHLATGGFPVEGRDIASLRRAHQERTPTSLASARADLPREMCAAVDRATARDPADRFPSVAAFRNALLQETSTRSIRSRIATISRRRLHLGAAASAACLLALAGWFWQRTAEAPIAFAARDWVLVARFENRTGEPAFDDLLEQALQQELVGSGFVNVVPRPRIEDALTLMKRSPDSPLDAHLAREVALRDGGIRVLLAGRFDRIGGTYVLTTNIMDPADERIVATVTSDVGTSTHLLRGVRDQAFRVRRILGEALWSIERSRTALAKVTTPSTQALQLYSKAAALLDGEYWRSDPEVMFRSPDAMSRYASAESLLQQATDLDPTFASAWMLRAHAMFNQRRPPREYRPIAERALELSGTVSPVERSLIEGFVWRHRRWEADYAAVEHSVRAYETVLQLVPDHYWALLELQFLYSVLGRQSDAERVTLHAASVRPHAFRFAIDSARIRLRHGDAAAARAIIQRLSSGEAAGAQGLAGTPPESLAWFRLWGAHEAWLNGDAGRALQEVQMVEQGWTSRHYLGLYALANAYQGLGRYLDAERVARRMQPPQTAFFLALIAARRERWGDLRRLLNPERPDFELLDLRFHHLVRAGWLREAAWVLDERQRRNVIKQPNTQNEQEGQLFVAEGRFAEGMARLEPLTLARAGPRFATDDIYAAARRAVGDLPGAIRHLEQISEMRAQAVSHDAWQVTSWLDCRVRLAEYYVEAGRPSDAARVADDARRLLAVADSDHPLLVRLQRLPTVQGP
jgi:tetratricopeptide (TPR) repeat protein